jgi:cystathionine beta-lyase
MNRMTRGPDFDLSLDRLREIGSLKWTQHPDALGAFVAEMDFGTAPVVSDAMHRAIDDGLLGYLPGHLETAMAESFTDFAADRYGWRVDPAGVRPLADVAAGLVAAVEELSEPGRPVIVPTPAYMPFLFLPQTLGREVIEVPMAVDGGRYVYDLEALDAAYEAGGHLLVVVNPHNPIGRVLEEGELRAVSEVVERHGGRVFADEIHAPLVYDGHRHVPYASVSDAAARHSVTAVSASKAWNIPGTKCAQLVLTNDADAARWAEVGLRSEHGASTLGVVANIAAYRDGGPWLEEVLAHLDANRRVLAELLAEHLPEVGYTPPEGTYLAWLDCRRLGLEAPGEFFREKAGVAMTEGRLCGRAGAGFVRHNVATPRPLLEQSVVAMARALGRG